MWTLVERIIIELVLFTRDHAPDHVRKLLAVTLADLAHDLAHAEVVSGRFGTSP